MSDRIVDELNPDAHLSSKEVHSLICDEEEDPEPMDMTDRVSNTNDPVMNSLLGKYGSMLTKPPICHEAQLVDRKDNKLSKEEKKLAEQSYKLEKTSKITYSRPSYAAFYPKQGSFATNLHNPGSSGFTRNRYFENGKKLDNWMPAASMTNNTTSSMATANLRQEKSYSPDKVSSPVLPKSKNTFANPFPMPSFSNVLSAPPPCSGSGFNTGSSKSFRRSTGSSSSDGDWSKPSTSTTRYPDNSVISRPSVVHNMTTPHGIRSHPGSDTEAAQKNSDTQASSSSSQINNLSKQGIVMQEVKVPRDLLIPTNPGEPPILLAAGQSVSVIRTPKGTYLRMEEKIIKIKQHSTVSGLFTNGASSSSTGTGSDSEESDSTCMSLPSVASSLKT